MWLKTLTTTRSTVPSGSLPAPLPPSVEEAYRKKCIELRRRMNEVEESNDAYRLRKIRLTRAIRKMRLERAYLLEILGKRMKKNGTGGDELQGFFDEESEGSSEGPPTPHEKPLRSKRSHRRMIPSPPPPLDNQLSQNPQYQAPTFQAYRPEHPSQEPQPLRSPTNGQTEFRQYQPSRSSSLPATEQAPSQAVHTHPMVTPLPPPTAFQMYLEERYLSEPQEHSSKSANTPESLTRLAQENWEAETQGTRQYYLLQESKLKEQYEQQLALAKEYEARGGRSIEREVEATEGEKMDVDVIEKGGEAGQSAAE